MDNRVLFALVAASSLSGVLGAGAFAKNYGAEFPAQTLAQSAERGRRLFFQSCAHCHGNDARGNGEDGDGPDLFALRISNARIRAVIRAGIPEEMPSFKKKHGSADIADLTAYLRTLR